MNRDRDYQDYQNWIAGSNILGAHPRFNDRLPQNDKYCRHRQHDERARSVSGDIYLAQPIHVANCVRLAGHGYEDLCQTGDDFSGVVDQARTNGEVGDGRRGEKCPDHQGIRFEPQTAGQNDHECDAAVVRHFAEGATVHIAPRKGNRQNTEYDAGSQDRREYRQGHCDQGNG